MNPFFVNFIFNVLQQIKRKVTWKFIMILSLLHFFISSVISEAYREFVKRIGM
jgi:CRISPR/Cas system endoribonuclease Cas6 (RAMP superfamily)